MSTSFMHQKILGETKSTHLESQVKMDDDDDYSSGGSDGDDDGGAHFIKQGGRGGLERG